MRRPPSYSVRLIVRPHVLTHTKISESRYQYSEIEMNRGEKKGCRDKIRIERNRKLRLEIFVLIGVNMDVLRKPVESSSDQIAA